MPQTLAGTTTMCPCGLKARYTCNRAVHPRIRSRGMDSVQTTDDKAACLHDATSAFDHEDNIYIYIYIYIYI